jgi:hypothetical protein
MNNECDVELEKLEEAIIKFAEKEKIDCVFGSKNKVKITESERYSFPSKNSKEREQLEELLRKHDKYETVSQLDTTTLGEIIKTKQWEPELLKALKKHVELEKNKRLYLSKMKES